MYIYIYIYTGLYTYIYIYIYVDGLFTHERRSPRETKKAPSIMPGRPTTPAPSLSLVKGNLLQREIPCRGKSLVKENPSRREIPYKRKSHVRGKSATRSRLRLPGGGRPP